jgi:hypothetical protein
VWEVRAFTGRDERGRPTQVSRTVHGTKKDAQRAAAEMTVQPPGQGAGRTVADALRQWADVNDATWAPSTRRDQRGRLETILRDRIERLARLNVADVDGGTRGSGRPVWAKRPSATATWVDALMVRAGSDSGEKEGESSRGVLTLEA